MKGTAEKCSESWLYMYACEKGKGGVHCRRKRGGCGGSKGKVQQGKQKWVNKCGIDTGKGRKRAK